MTVMAITAILMTIITIPIVQSFNLTRAAQGFADAQERARQLIDTITRECTNAAGVRENSGDLGAVDVVVPGLNGATEIVRLYNTKLDLMMPSSGEPVYDPATGALKNPNRLINPSGNPNDPNNWKIDPTMRTPIGQVTLPTATGFRLVRYFVGLRNPFGKDPGTGQASELYGANYNNPYDSIMVRGQGQDNLYVLYRAEVDFRTLDRTNPANPIWRINTALFPDLNGDGFPDLDDPSFFRQYQPGEARPSGGPAYSAADRQAKANLIKEWQKRSRIVTEISRYDMIQPLYDRATFKAIYDGNVPRIQPLVQFKPGRVASEPVEGSMVVRAGLEFENADKMGPDRMRTKFGSWSNALVRTWPSQLSLTAPSQTFAAWQPGTPYEIGRTRYAGGVAAGFSLFDFQNIGSESSDGVETFDVSAYSYASSIDPGAKTGTPQADWFPFSYAVNQANARSGWLSDAAVRSRFIPYALAANSGEVRASFGIDEVGTGGTAINGADNRPVSFSGADQTPAEAPAVAAGSWTNAQYSPSSPTSEVNSRFNVMYKNWATLCPSLGIDSCRRFIDLRFLPCNDGTSSPLNPLVGFPRARIVPGSEIVIGPNQNPGPEYGQPVRYTRVGQDSVGNVVVGRNQYTINYVDRADSSRYNELGFPGVSTDPTTYQATNFAYAVLQPRFKVGYLEFCSDPTIPIPVGSSGRPWNISVYYRFQFTESSDVFAVDYDTRQMMDTTLTIRNFPQSTLPNAQTVTLHGSARVRNVTR